MEKVSERNNKAKSGEVKGIHRDGMLYKTERTFSQAGIVENKPIYSDNSGKAYIVIGTGKIFADTGKEYMVAYPIMCSKDGHARVDFLSNTDFIGTPIDHFNISDIPWDLYSNDDCFKDRIASLEKNEILLKNKSSSLEQIIQELAKGNNAKNSDNQASE